MFATSEAEPKSDNTTRLFSGLTGWGVGTARCNLTGFLFLDCYTSGCQKSSLDARIFLRLWKDRVHWESQPRNENTPRTAFLRIPEMNTKSHALPYKNKSCWVCAKGKAHFYSFLPQYLIRVHFFLLCGAFGHLVYQSMKLYLIRFEILHYINI